MMTKYEIHLDGVHAMDLSLGVLRDLVDLLLDGASRAARLAVEGRSTDEEVSTFQKLALETPAPKIDRVVGVLDSLTMSTRTAVLKLSDGFALKGNVGANIGLESVKDLLGTEVLVEGTVAFRPSARP